MSNYSRWAETIEKHDKEDGICELLDDVFAQGVEFEKERIEEIIRGSDDVFNALAEIAFHIGGE